MSPSSAPDQREERIGRLLNEFLDRRARGLSASEQSLLAGNPEVANELREHLAILRRMSPSGPGIPSGPERLDPEAIPGYRLIEELGRGGMGVVYKAYHLGTKGIRALKIMLEGPLASPSARRRFEREVELAAQFRHPNVVTIRDSGDAGDRHFLAMDYIEGEPLDAFVRARQLGLRETLRLFVKVCDGVSYAHRHGVLHRDLKPSNILVDAGGEPCVLDFGLARPLRGEDFSRLSVTGQVLGTLPYMSPEQSRGQASTLDTRSDVYSLGVILYELLTGSPPYVTDHGTVEMRDALRNIQEQDPLRPSKRRPAIGSELDAIILRALQKEPARRYQSVGELRDDLQARLEGRPVTARSDSSLYVLYKLARRHYFHTAVIATLLAAMAGFGGIAFHALLRERESARALESINRQVQGRLQSFEDLAATARAKTHEQALGWFLLAWHSGYPDAAQRLAESIPAGSAEGEAARFLLDESGTVEQLQAAVGPGAASLVLFVAAEKHLKAGRTAEARAALQQYQQRYDDAWRPFVEARLEALDLAESVGAKPASSGPSR